MYNSRRGREAPCRINKLITYNINDDNQDEKCDDFYAY